MGTHLKVLSESYTMNTDMTGFRWFSEFSCDCVWTKEVSVLEGLTVEQDLRNALKHIYIHFDFFSILQLSTSVTRAETWVSTTGVE